EFLSGKISTAEGDVYVIVASGKGHWAANQDDVTFYELVTLAAEPMDMDMVSLDVLEKGIAEKGRVPVYDIFFETGDWAVKDKSDQALKVVSDFMKVRPGDAFLIVGHTDNAGEYDFNVKLSMDRARAVVEKLTEEYGIDAGRLKPVGVGSASPVLSNNTEEGKVRNRRVEIVKR
ncbi:MAG: OmpA family protein, partial [Marinilabiliaceae bacterium]